MRHLKYLNSLVINQTLRLFIFFMLVLSLGVNDVIPTASAEPKMTVNEAPLEGTHVYRLRVNNKGFGRIVLSCHRCPNKRIRLRVTPTSYAVVNGELVSMSQYSQGSRDLITGFYKPESKELTWLQVERL